MTPESSHPEDPAPAPAPTDEDQVDLLAALDRAVPRVEPARSRRIFVNRNLRLDDVDIIGFDMDYTLARYRQDRLEALSLTATVDKLVAQGWPELLREVSEYRMIAYSLLLILTAQDAPTKFELSLEAVTS